MTRKPVSNAVKIAAPAAILILATLVQFQPALGSTTVPAGTISTDTTWNVAGSPYLIAGNVTVEGTDGGDGVTTLTIEPGVEVRFQGNFTLRFGGFSVAAPGALVADGNAAGGPATIVFTSDQSSPAAGDWGGIHLRTGAHESSVLRNVLIEYAGSSSLAGVYLQHAAAATVTLESVTVRNSAYDGIYQASGPTVMSEITVTDSVRDGMHIASGDADLSQVTIAGSGDNAIEVASSLFSLDVCTLGTSTSHDIRIVNGVSGTVTNCPSLQSVFYAGTTSEVAWSGNTFQNWGALTSRVGASDLGGLIVDNTINKIGGAALEIAAGTVSLDSVWTADAGSPYTWYGSVTVQGADGGDGVTTLAIEPGLEHRMQGNWTLRVGGFSVAAPGALVADGNAAGGPATIVFTSDQSSPAAGDWGGIHLRTGAHESSVLRNVLIEYAGSSSLAGVYLQHAAAATVTLEDVTVRDSAYDGIYQASGPTVMSDITVTDSVRDGMHIASGDADLSQVTIAGSGDNAIEVASSLFSLDVCTLGTSTNHDIRIVNGVSGTVTNCPSLQSVFYAGTTSELAWSGNTFNSWGTLTSRVGASDLGGLIADNTINKIGGAALEIAAGTVSLDSVWTADAGSPYTWYGSVTVQGADGGDGVTTLAIEPGLEHRMQGNWRLSVGGFSVAAPGALVVDGNAAGGPATIVFTSNQSSPAAGDWGGIHLRTGADDSSVLRNVLIEYAGSSSLAGVYLQHAAAATVTLESVTVRNSAYDGIYQSSGPTVMSEITVTDSARDGVHIASGDADLSQVTIAGSGDNAIEVASSLFSLDVCTLGTSTNHDIRIVNGVSGTVTNCPSLQSVFYAGTTSELAWSGNTFNSWGTLTSRVGASDLGGLIADNTINKIGGAALEIAAGTVSLDSVWTADAGSPYTWYGSVTVQGADGGDGVTTLTLEPGLEHRMQGNWTLRVGGFSVAAPGALVVDGNAAGGPATIVFTSNQSSPAAGDWGAIHLRTGAHESSVLRNVLIEYAGSSSLAGVYLQHAAAATVTLESVTVRNSAYDGIYQAAGPTVMSGIMVTDSARDGVHIASGDADLSQVTIAGSGDNAIEVASSLFSLDVCTLGTSTNHDIRIVNGVSGTVTNCPSLQSVFYAGTTSEVAWSGNTFDIWGTLTSRVGASDLGGLIADNTINKIGGAALEIAAGTVSLDSVWTADAGSPYTWYGSVTVEGTDGGDGVTTLTLEPGLEHRMQGNWTLRVGGFSVAAPGALVVDGNAAGGPATIVFTSDQSSPAAGDWGAIHLRTGAHESSVLRNVLIEYAGSSSLAGVYLQHAASATVTLEDITVRDSAYYGIYAAGSFELSACTLESNAEYDLYLTGTITGSVDDCASIESVYYGSASPDVTWAGNTFNNWGTQTSRVSANDAGRLSSGETGNTNTFNPVPGAVLEVFSETIELDSTWTADPGPYIVTPGSLTVQGTDGIDGRTTLTLQPGVAVKMPSNSYLYVGGFSGDPGELITDGNLGGGAFDTINFNSSAAVPSTGDWRGIRVRETGRASLQETQIRYADTGLGIDGTLGVMNRVTVNRANVGLDLNQPTLEETLHGMFFKNCDVAVRSAGADPVLRGSNLIGATYGVENLTPGANCVDAGSNWWGTQDGPSGDPPVLGCETEDPVGSGSPITDGVLFASWSDVPPDDGDTIACDDGDGFPDPCTPGMTMNCDDNCCFVANESQADEDGDGVGDACDANPVLRVSSDPADGADFEVVQEAVDASYQSGTRVEIFPGLGPYLEPVRVDRNQLYFFTGLENIAADPVIVDGGAGPAFRAVNKVGTTPMAFRNLTLRGNQGIRTAVDTDLRDIVFEMIVQEALELDAGSHAMTRSEIRELAAVGVRVAAGASLDVSRTTMHGLTDAGLVVAGTVTLENTVIAGGVGADGIRMASTGSADIRYCTIADNTGIGIDNTQGGSGSVDRSIIYGNALDDLVNLDCTHVSWTDTGIPDCSSLNDNLAADPLLDAGYRPQDGSPCLDHGPPASTYTGDPPTDADGGPRLLDHDGDGIALNDCGAYEMSDPTLVPGEVVNVRWDFNFRMLWDAEPSAVEYHVYRDALSSLSFVSFGACADGIDGNRTDLQLDDLEDPAPAGAGFFYLITAEDALGAEGTLGLGTHAERSNFTACP